MNKITKEGVERIIELKKSGVKIKKIAEEVGLNYTTVSYWLKKYELGMPLIPTKPTDKRRYIKKIANPMSGKCYMDYLKELAEKEKKAVKSYLYGVVREDKYKL